MHAAPLKVYNRAAVLRFGQLTDNYVASASSLDAAKPSLSEANPEQQTQFVIKKV